MVYFIFLLFAYFCNAIHLEWLIGVGVVGLVILIGVLDSDFGANKK